MDFCMREGYLLSPVAVAAIAKESLEMKMRKNFFFSPGLSLPNRGSVRVMKDEGTGLTWTPGVRH